MNLLHASCAAVLVLCSLAARAEITILETAAMGPTGQFGGIIIDSTQFLAARLHVDEPTNVMLQAAHSFRAAGLITASEQRSMVRAAVRSPCGRKPRPWR